ncbi:MAG: hypothetical protein V2J12_02910 [Gammaproteobacteria bacterium]|nr:hypothetical protein [Gammaproteobacteria bacterium]
MLPKTAVRIVYVLLLLAALAWFAAAVRLALLGDWRGLVICCVGLLGTTMIGSSLYSRSRRPLGRRHTRDHSTG